MTVAERVQAQDAPHVHQGMIALYTELARRYGPASIKAASMAISLEQEVGTFELFVSEEQMDEASLFAAELTVSIEDEFNEAYSVLVLRRVRGGLETRSPRPPTQPI